MDFSLYNFRVADRSPGPFGEDAYVEAVAVLRQGARAEQVTSWFREHSLETVPMRAGLLIRGNLSAFRCVLGVQLHSIDAAGHERLDVPVPTELRDEVVSITIPRFSLR